MADKKNLCAQIDIALHNRVTEEKDRLEMTTSQYIAQLLTEYYEMKENGGITEMSDKGRTHSRFRRNFSSGSSGTWSTRVPAWGGR